MGGVVKAISSAVSSVVDTVGDAVEWVGDTVSNVVENALDDPLKTAAQIAVIAATGGTGAGVLGLSAPISAMTASASLAAIEGIDVLEEGGSIEDALKGAATTFAVSQGVNFATNSFGTPGVSPSGGETMQFFDDGTSIQFFDDGSSIFTDTAGAINATPATDMISPVVSDSTGFTPSGLEQPATPGVSELAPIAETGPAEITPIAGTETPSVAPEVIAATTPTQPQFDTMEDLLASIGEMPPEQLPGVFGGDVEAQLGYNQPSIPFPEAIEPTAAPIDFAQGIEDIPPIPSDYQDRSMLDVGLDLAKEAYEATPGSLIAAGALSGLGALTGQPEMPPGPTEPPPRTYNYNPPVPIGATRGLQELYSAASDIYGGRTVQPTVPNIPPPGTPSTYAPPPLIGGASGIASLRMPFTPMAGGQTFDISTLTPEQIIQLQNIASGRRALGE